MPFKTPPETCPVEGNRGQITQGLKYYPRLLAMSITLFTFTIVLETVARASLPFLSAKHSPTRETQPATLPAQLPYNLTLNQCGSSPGEAKSLGCVFDELSFAWQVPECYDEETVSEFLAGGGWQYYADETGTTTVPHHVLPLGGQPVHVTLKFHITHCLFLRRQMVRLLERGAPMDNHLGAYKHTVHCGKYMLKAAEMADDLHTSAPVIYPVCKSLEDWRI